jgi:rod shape-determining protein MreB and related proteins
MRIDNFLSMFTSDIAIDLGTANTLIYVKGEGIVANEPSVVAVHEKDSRGTKSVRAVGKEAKEMIGKAPVNITVIRPLKDGVIADFEVAHQMLRYFIKHAYKRGSFIKPRIAIGVPYGITEVEKRTVKEAALSAGAREVFLVEQPMAAAVGANLPVTEPTGNMIVDIGGGTTEVAVISLAGIVYSKSVKSAGDKMDEGIIEYIKKKYNLAIGERMAEIIKWRIGNAYPDENKEFMEVKGLDLVAGVPKTIEISSDEIRESLEESVRAIISAIKTVLENTPPELAADIVDKGIVLAGGGALLQNLDILIREETNLPVIIADDPLKSVVLGTGKILENISLLKTISLH